MSDFGGMDTVFPHPTAYASDGKALVTSPTDTGPSEDELAPHIETSDNRVIWLADRQTNQG